MSLGNFTVGSTVRIPLQVLENGGIPATEISNVKIQELIKPDLSKDSNFPSSMTLLSSTYSVYYFITTIYKIIQQINCWMFNIYTFRCH